MTDPPPIAVTREELQLATRNHGMPLEALRYPITPVGLHYLLIHYDVPLIDASTWRLQVEGRVATPVDLTLDDLRSMPVTTQAVTMECAGNGRALAQPRAPSVPWLVEAVGTGEWTGVALPDVLDAAGLLPDAVEVVFGGADRGIEGGVEQTYRRSLTVSDANSVGALLAYELNGAPLPPQHGFPLRLVVPGWYGMTNVKWLTAITAVSEPFDGYQQATSYRVRHGEDEPGEPVTRMVPRSLMVPPGIPDFFSRVRVVRAGDCELTGRAWSGHGPIVEVGVSTDGGATWHAAEVGAPTLGPAAWMEWRYVWHAEPGNWELCCRTSDAAGNRQPLEPAWNLGGYANNVVHRIAVRVVDG